MIAFIPIVKRTMLIVLGCLFFCGWVYAHCMWAALCIIPNLMANDSGRATGSQHLSLFIGMLTGQALAAAAGIPGGLFFFWHGKRLLMFVLFLLLFAVGALLQYSALTHFFSNMM